MEIKEAFGQALKQARLANKLTQEDFSDVSSRTYVSTLERFKYSPTIEKVEGIARHIGIHPLTLISLAYLIKNPELPFDDLFKQVSIEIKNLERTTG